MAKKCDAIQEKLSAYLDGCLAPGEQAEVEEHLSLCAACAEVLEKMRRLETIASGAVTDIDETLLNRLEQRIRVDIARLPTVDVSRETARRGRVIPIWFRYVATAASLLLVFMVGYKAYDRYGGSWFKQTPVTPPAEMSQPPALIQTPPSRPAVTPAEEKTTPSRDKDEIPSQTGQKTTVPPKVGIPKPQPQETTMPKPTEKDQLQDIQTTNRPATKQAVEADTYQAPTIDDTRAPVGESRAKESALSKSSEMMPVEVSKGTEEAQTTESAARSKIITAPVEQGEVTVSSREAAGESGRAKVSSATESMQSEQAAIADYAQRLQGNLANALSKFSGRTSYAPKAEAKPAASLNKLYEEALAAYESSRKKDQGARTDAIREEYDSMAVALAVWNRARADAGGGSIVKQVEGLYVAARAGSDLYHFTGDDAYYVEAVRARQKALALIDDGIVRGEDIALLTAYREEIKQWRLEK